MTIQILAVGRIIGGGDVQWHIAPLAADVDATVDEVFGKAPFDLDDDAPSLGLVFTQYDDDYGIEDDASWIRSGC